MEVKILGVVLSDRRLDGYKFVDEDCVEATTAEPSDVAEEGVYVISTLVVVGMGDDCVPPTFGIRETSR